MNVYIYIVGSIIIEGEIYNNDVEIETERKGYIFYLSLLNALV